MDEAFENCKDPFEVNTSPADGGVFMETKKVLVVIMFSGWKEDLVNHIGAGGDGLKEVLMNQIQAMWTERKMICRTKWEPVWMKILMKF